MRNGVFRTYPGHRSNRLYNPVSRSWYKRALHAWTKTTLSAPYLDAAGAGKIITVSQAVFEGMLNVSKEYCENQRQNKTNKIPDGCHCSADDECASGVCYVSKAKGFDINLPRCATNRLIAVTGTDLGYNDFHRNIVNKMKSSDGMKSCGFKYKCPDEIHECETRCYLFDNYANVIIAPEFINEKDLEEKKYSQVNLGIVEGEIMKELIYKHKFFKRSENIDFSGTCTISPYQPKVTLEGIPLNPEDQDNYYKNRGPIPSFQNEYGCIQDAVRYSVDFTVLGKYQSKILVGNVSGPCMNGYYYIAAMPKTNLFLLVIENAQNYKESLFYNFNCRITRKYVELVLFVAFLFLIVFFIFYSIVNSGNFQLLNGTCAHQDLTSKTMREESKCPVLKTIEIPCEYNNANGVFYLKFFLIFVLLNIMLLF
jgi:voltage-dependent calcium channel alpha-2/delta-3